MGCVVYVIIRLCNADKAKSNYNDTFAHAHTCTCALYSDLAGNLTAVLEGVCMHHVSHVCL